MWPSTTSPSQETLPLTPSSLSSRESSPGSTALLGEPSTVSWSSHDECCLSIAFYVFYSSLYSDEQKNYPKVDFLITALLAFFWLAGSSAWANGLNGMKDVADPDNWIWTSQNDKAAACFKTSEGTYSYTKIGECHTTSRGHFGGANVSVLFGFLNFFLWASNLWFLYKETNWYKAKQDQSNLGNLDPDAY